MCLCIHLKLNWLRAVCWELFFLFCNFIWPVKHLAHYKVLKSEPRKLNFQLPNLNYDEMIQNKIFSNSLLRDSGIIRNLSTWKLKDVVTSGLKNNTLVIYIYLDFEVHSSIQIARELQILPQVLSNLNTTTQKSKYLYYYQIIDHEDADL